MELAREGLVDLLGSDAHSSHAGRPVALAAGFARLATVSHSASRSQWSVDRAPQAIVRGDPVTPRPVTGSSATLSTSRSTTSREALPRPWRRKLAAPAAAPTMSARSKGSPRAQVAASAPIIASPQPSRKPRVKRGGVSHHARSPASTSAGRSPRVTITAPAPSLAQPLRRGAQLCGLGHGTAHELGQLPVVQFHQVGLAAQRAVQPRRGEIDQRAASACPRVGDQVAVDLQRQRLPGHRVGDDEPAVGDRLRAGDREQLVELVAGRGIAERAGEQLALAGATIGHVAAARGRRVHQTTLAAECAAAAHPAARRSPRPGTRTAPARRPGMAAMRATHTPCPPAWKWTCSRSGPSRSRVTVSSGWGAKIATRGADEFMLTSAQSRSCRAPCGSRNAEDLGMQAEFRNRMPARIRARPQPRRALRWA